MALFVLPDLWKLAPLVLSALGQAGFMIYAAWYSKRYPILAAMDEGSAVAYLQTELTAKDPKVIVGSSRPVTNPVANTPEGDAERITNG